MNDSYLCHNFLSRCGSILTIKNFIANSKVWFVDVS